MARLATKLLSITVGERNAPQKAKLSKGRLRSNAVGARKRPLSLARQNGDASATANLFYLFNLFNLFYQPPN